VSGDFRKFVHREQIPCGGGKLIAATKKRQEFTSPEVSFIKTEAPHLGAEVEQMLHP
jgi:hypothetical protein